MLLSTSKPTLFNRATHNIVQSENWTEPKSFKPNQTVSNYYRTESMTNKPKRYNGLVILISIRFDYFLRVIKVHYIIK